MYSCLTRTNRSVTRFIKRHAFVDSILLAVVVIFLATGWLNDGLPKGHDILAGSNYAWQFKSLSSFGNILPDWNSYWYLGSPFYYVFPSVFTRTLIVLSLVLDDIVALKLLAIAVFAAAGIFMYHFVHNLSKNRYGSLIAGLVYLLAPYHLFGAIFEGHCSLSLAYALAPLVFLRLDRTIANPTAQNTIISGVVLALLILSAPQAFPILVGPFLALYMVFHALSSIKDRAQLKTTLQASAAILLVGLSLSAFWWVPLSFERGEFASTEFSLETAANYRVTFMEAISLRPSSCCNPSGAYSELGSYHIKALALFPFALALIGVFLNCRNRRIWFFSFCGILAVLLVLGLDSPIGLYEFCHNHVPLFSSIRTPGRFLLMTSFVYAFLAGFAVKSIAEAANRSRSRQDKIPAVICIILCALIIGNIYGESRKAFQTFELTQDQQCALSWLSEQEEGRVMAIPLRTWVFSPDANRNIVDPMCYTRLHGKENLIGGAPALATDATESFLGKLSRATRHRETNLGEISDLLGVRYAIVDKTNPVSANCVLDDSFIKVWESDTIDIYENEDPYPRIFTSIPVEEENLDIGGWTWIEGSQHPARLTISHEYASERAYSWRSDYVFDNEGHNWLDISTDFQIRQEATTLSFWYYLPQPLPSATMTAILWEEDGSEYDHNVVSDMTEGWHEARLPLSEFDLAQFADDDNAQLDMEQISQLRIRVEETKNDDKPHKFSIYFSQIYTAANCEEEMGEWQWIQGNQWPAQATLSHEHTRDLGYSWRSDYVFDKKGYNWMNISTDFRMPQEATSLSFWYYLPEALPGATMSIMLHESDGSGYWHDLAADMSSTGWHKAEISLNAPPLHWSTEDENDQLDNEEISQLWIGIKEVIEEDEVPHNFSVYLSPIATVTEWEEAAEIEDWQWAQGTQDTAQVMMSHEHARTLDYGHRSDYFFDKEGRNWMNISTDIQVPRETTTISLSYYLPETLPEVTMNVMLWESDGSGYICYTPVADTSSGWHTVEIPLSLFLLQWSTDDENLQLDSEEISRLWVLVTEDKEDETPHSFSIYYGNQISTRNCKIEAVDFSSVHPGKYEIQLDCDDPCNLILRESYYPGWEAKIEGQSIHSERAFGFLNRWHVDTPGQHKLTLEFIPSLQRTTGRIISYTTAIAIGVFFVVRWSRRRWFKQAIASKNDYDTTCAKHEE